jgi:hypothetical protein
MPDPYREGSKDSWFVVQPAGPGHFAGERVCSGDAIRLVSQRWGWTAYTAGPHSLGERRVVAAQWCPRWEASLCRAVQWVLRVGYGHVSVSVVDSWRIVVYSKAWTDDTVGADATVDTRGHGQVCCDARCFCCPS